MDDTQERLSSLIESGFSKEQAEKILVATMEITFVHVEKDMIAQGMKKEYVEQALREARSIEYGKLVECLGKENV